MKCEKHLIYLHNFDILKVVAATFIVFHHYQQITGVTFSFVNFFGGLFSFGNLVELFFLLSGFLTEYTFSKNSFSCKWLLHRLLRFYPYAFIATLFSLVIATIYYLLFGSSMFNISYDVKTIVTSLTMTHTGWFTEYSPAINNPTWYLCVLILCYMFYFFIRHVLINCTIIAVLSFSAISLLSGGIYYYLTHEPQDLPFFHLSNCRGYAPFFLGCMLCIICKIIHRKHLVVITYFWICAFLFGIYINSISNWYVLTYFLFPAIVLSFFLLPQIKNKFISNLGKISFSVYIWHVPIISFFITISYSMGGVRITHSYLTMFTFCFIVWVFSTCIYFFVEKPLGKILTRLA